MAAPTVDEILNNLLVYSRFEQTGSVADANEYITAARQFLTLPASSSEQGSSAAYSVEHIHRQMEIARRFVAQNNTATTAGSSVRWLSAREGFRR